ncbi:MAG: family 43 glycosylhydrolase, partial [Lachnospiraceae bacterium]|nr:family 43 glycosylhydrolase [Lachnospiraceae bacterium]
GYVHYDDGTRLGEREGDEPQFDPGVLTEGERTYLYTGFCGIGDPERSGVMATVLASDMLTIIENPVFIVPGNCYGKGTDFEGYEYFEAASIRKIEDTYYFVYSSTQMNELCYATSKSPTKDFRYGGVIVSNCDLNIDTYKPKSMRAYPAGNNHGSIIEINGVWYVFYHRMTNGTWFSRQGLIERITVEDNGDIAQVEMTSLGANGKPLKGQGEYPAYIACVLYNPDEGIEEMSAKITQDGKEGDELPCYIGGITDSTVIGFKYFDCRNINKVSIIKRGYCKGRFEVRTSLDGGLLGSIEVISSNIWLNFEADINIPDGINALYFTYKGTGKFHLRSFILAN